MIVKTGLLAAATSPLAATEGSIENPVAMLLFLSTVVALTVLVRWAEARRRPRVGRRAHEPPPDPWDLGHPTTVRYAPQVSGPPDAERSSQAG